MYSFLCKFYVREILCHFFGLHEISDGIMCLFACANFFIYLPASVNLTFHRHIGIWLWQLKSLVFRDRYNNNLMHITAGDLRSWCLFCCVSVCLSFYLYVQKMCISHFNGMILAGTHNNTMLQLNSIYKWFCFENGEIIVN